MNNHFYKGHKTRKRFSQIFLHDSVAINAIVAAFHPTPGQAIVEIGPGLGALTEPIVKLANHITVIEIDRDLVTRLASDSFLQSKLTIIQQDVMTFNFAAFSTEKKQTLRIFGNLPYHIATQIIFYLFRHVHIIHDMCFMLQKEVVNRLVAQQNSKAYGRLSIIAQYYCKVIPILEVPQTSFRPLPKVDSIVVLMIPYVKPLFHVQDIKTLNIITHLAFNQRRKMLRNSLRHIFHAEQLMEQGISATLRAENVSIQHYCHLANMLATQIL